jgi:hypothetical protein
VPVKKSDVSVICDADSTVFSFSVCIHYGVKVFRGLYIDCTVCFVCVWGGEGVGFMCAFILSFIPFIVFLSLTLPPPFSLSVSHFDNAFWTLFELQGYVMF